ncbi:MAG: hypothetical protein ACOYNC_16670 [Bacteroidales bacterium]
MKPSVLSILAFILFISSLRAQVGINSDNSQPDPSSMLDVNSTTKGVLLTRMTRIQRNEIINPANGLMVYCTDCGTGGSLSIFTNGSWMTFSPCLVAQPIAGLHTLTQGQVVWNWAPVAGATGYKWNTTPDYESAIDLGATTSYIETGTSCGTTYNRYIWAYNTCGESAMAAFTASVPLTAPEAPTPATNISTRISITWNWNAVADAIGYKWNTSDDFSTATDLFNGTSKEETGLECNASYNCYVWAYNGCGTSSSLNLTQTTQACWACGDQLTVSHITSNGVAPVDKTTTYETTNGIPGETGKCWITKNLGADQQASSVIDNTELSAGWYWQFNRKQGYKHDGTTRTPATLWISSINEPSDWTTLNDPCAIELASGWRIPTNTEWTNVDAAGGWTSQNGPYSSVLKLHDAGYLTSSYGFLDFRGSYGFYWSSTQFAVNTAWFLDFSTNFCLTISDYKAFAFSLRCIRAN